MSEIGFICGFCAKPFGVRPQDFGLLVHHQTRKHFHYNSGYRELMEIRRPDTIIELKRAPGTCCPEPTCDHNPDCLICEMCSSICSECKRGEEGEKVKTHEERNKLDRRGKRNYEQNLEIISRRGKKDAGENRQKHIGESKRDEDPQTATTFPEDNTEENWEGSERCFGGSIIGA